MPSDLVVPQHAGTHNAETGRGPTTIVVAVLTCRRPKMLDRLLLTLSQIDAPPQANVVWLVIDNDSQESARSTVEAHRCDLVNLHYVPEPAPGIPVARNRAISEALSREADVLCFIDDDEYPDRQWLVQLVDTWRSTRAHLIGGPVRLAPAPAAANYWQRFVHASLVSKQERRYLAIAAAAASGKSQPVFTGNWLCDLAWLRQSGIRFDERLLVAGGSDMAFYRSARAAGCVTAWCPEAIAHETASLDRLSLCYQLHRATSQSANHFHMKHSRLTPGHAMATVLNAVVRAILGGLLLVFPVSGKASPTMAIGMIGWAAGRLWALRGGRSLLYAHVHEPVAVGKPDHRKGSAAPASAASQGQTWAVLRRLFVETAHTRRKEYGLAVAAMVVVAVATAGMAWLMRSAINDVFVHRDMAAMWLVAAGIFVLSLIKGGADYFQAVKMTQISNGMIADLQRRMFDKLLTMQVAFFTRTHSSKQITQINNSARAASSALTLVTTALGRDLPTLVGLVAVMVFQDPLLSLLAFLIGPVVIYANRQIVRKLRRLADSEFQGMADVIAAVQETCQGIRTVKSFTLEPLMRTRLDRAVTDVERRSNAIARIGKLTSPLMESLGGIVIASMVVYSGWQTVHHGKTPGEFMAFVTAFLLAYEPAKRLASVQVGLQRNLRRVHGMYAMLDLPEQEKVGAAIQPAVSVRGHIALSHLTFGYGRAPVLHDVSLDIEPGKVVALVGPSGAGKSTLFSLLQRFYDPHEGCITIDGVDLATLDPASVRCMISVVSQDTTLFSGSISDNIRMGRPDASQEEVEAAAKAASAYDFITAMPRGFDTLIGERQATLSGGQAQRLAIARAVLKAAPILLLDEATSSLDGETEREVRDALVSLMQGRTTVVIAHRPSTIERADWIYVLRKGSVVHSGRHEDLLASSPLYQQLFGKASATQTTKTAA